MKKRVGIIGFGAIGRAIIDAWRAQPVSGHHIAALLVRERQQHDAAQLVTPDVKVCSDLESFLSLDLDLVVEVAGHGAIQQYGERILEAGIDMVVISVGSLADESLRGALERASALGRSRVLLPAGAIAGLDGLLSLRRSGLWKVKYTSTKPPSSWRDTPADRSFRLSELTCPTVIFSGSAAEAARLYPKNANLAAAVALAGLGLDKTQVELVADPSVSENIGRIEAEGAFARLTVELSGRSAPSNPKTSQITGMSVLAALENQDALIAFA